VRIELDHEPGELVVRVIDNGGGLPEGFEFENAGGLGLSIVRALVTSDLGGSIEAHGSDDQPGTTVEIRVPTKVARTT